MEHQRFPVAGFEFMDEPATEEQKDIIFGLAEKVGMPIKRHGEWPDPFSKWDAKAMIDALQEKLNERL